MNTNGPTVKAQYIPQRQREQLARSLLEVAREAAKDPQIMKEFKDWQEARKTKKGAFENA